MSKEAEAYASPEIPRYDDDCALCRVAKADKTGSHLAPNFLVHGAFSFDGKGGRSGKS